MTAWTELTPATCTENKWEVRRCASTVCAAPQKETREVADSALGHIASSTWTKTKDATCVAEGSESQFCTRPGCTAAVNTRDIEIDPEAHNWSAWQTRDPATCLTLEKQYRVCGTPGCIYEETRFFGALAAHTPGNWIVDVEATETTDGSRHKECTVCGQITVTETIQRTGNNGGCPQKRQRHFYCPAKEYIMHKIFKNPLHFI